jgi:transcriptional regulator with XRE-family HTH domain
LDQLKWLREQKGLSQAELGRISGVDRATINQLEHGGRNPSTPTLEKLAAALGVGIGEFFGPPQIKKAWLEAQGVTASDAELEVANNTVAALWELGRGKKPPARFVHTEVENDRVLMIIAYARAQLGELDWATLEAARERLTTM